MSSIEQMDLNSNKEDDESSDSSLDGSSSDSSQDESSDEESSGNKDEDEAKKGKKKCVKKRKRVPLKLTSDLLKDSRFKEWLTEHPNKKKCFWCSKCEKHLKPSNKKDLITHSTRIAHLKCVAEKESLLHNHQPMIPKPSQIVLKRSAPLKKELKSLN